MKPNSEILAYCLMPNHFHFLILTTALSLQKKKVGSLNLTYLSNTFRLTQSQYAQYFNRKYTRVGSVFRPKIKTKDLGEGNDDFAHLTFGTDGL